MSAKTEHILIDLCSSSSSSSSEDDGWDALMDVVLQDPAPVTVPDDNDAEVSIDLMEISSIKLQTTTIRKKRSHKNGDDDDERTRRVPHPSPTPPLPVTGLDDEVSIDLMDIKPVKLQSKRKRSHDDNAPVPSKRARSKSLPTPPTPTPNQEISTAATIPQIVQRQSTPEQAFVLPLEERLNPDSLRAILSMLSGEADISARGRLKQTCSFLNTFITKHEPFYKHETIPIYSQIISMRVVPFDLQDVDGNDEQCITDKEFLNFLVATGHFPSTLAVDTLLNETCITETMELEEIGKRFLQRREPIRDFLSQSRDWFFPCEPVSVATQYDFGQLSLLVKGRSIPFGSVKVPGFDPPAFSPFSTFRNDAIFQFSANVTPHSSSSSSIEVGYRVTMHVGRYDALMFSLPPGEQHLLRVKLVLTNILRMGKFFLRSEAYGNNVHSTFNVNERTSFFPTTTSISTMLPKNAYPLLAPPSGLNFILNDYQCEAISWMRHFEQHTIAPGKDIDYIAELPHFFGPMHRHGISLSPSHLKECAAAKVHYFVNTSSLDLIERDQLETNPAYQRTFTCKGGLLADATGLGKTVTILGHISNNLPEGPAHLMAHSLLRFQSRASLVVVPNSIAAQWHSEAQRFAGGKMKIIYLSKKLDLAKVTHEHIMKAGLIIVTAEFLERNLNDHYFHSRDVQRKHQMQQCEMFLADEENFLSERATCLDLFKYERIILDEAHILLDCNKYSTLWKPLSILHGKFYWAVTATPPTTLDLIFPFLQFLRVVPRISGETNSSFEPIMSRTLVTDEKGPKTRVTTLKATRLEELGFRFEFQAMMRAFVRACFWRNTQSNVAHFEDDHFKIPIARQRIFTVTLSPEEDLFVKAFTLMEMNLGLLDESNAFCRVGAAFRTLPFFSKHERNIYLTCSRLTMAIPKLGFSDPLAHLDCSSYDTHTSLHVQGSDDWPPLVHNLFDLGKRIESAMQTLPLEELGNALHRLETELSAIYEKLRTNSRNASALYKWMKKNEERNRCKKLLERMTSFHAAGINVGITLIRAALDLDEDFDPQIENKKSSFQLACTKYGTKAASVVQYLQTLYSTPNNKKEGGVRVLLFSQYMDTLENFHSLMKYLHVSASLVVGHVDRKTKAIREFNNGTIQALLIPVDKNAAGLHLVAATHVILLDPIMDSEGAATELQAIARAIRRGQTKPVDVVRFVVRDTREYEMVQKTLIATSLCEEVAYAPTCV